MRETLYHNEDYVGRLKSYNSTDQWEETRNIVLSLAREKDRILDYGCGIGTMLEALRKKDKTLVLVGADKSSMMLDRSRVRVPTAEVVAPGEVWGMSPFELISCVGMLEHTEQPDAVIRKLAGMLSEDGVLVIMVASVAYRRVRWLGNKLRGYKDDPTWEHPLPMGMLSSMLWRRHLEVFDYCSVGKTYLGFHKAHVLLARRHLHVHE